MLNFIRKRFVLFGVTASVVILSIAASLFLQAASAPETHVGCYHVVDVSGKDWYLVDTPQFDVNARAIILDTGYSSGYIWPASVEATYRCLEGLD